MHLADNTKICYTYDNLSRVTNRTIKNECDCVISSENFTYDAVGNITDAPDSCFGYDVNNRLTVFNGYDVSYDMDGNMLSNGTTEFEYDSANRLIKAGNHAYTYNAEDVRIRNLCGDYDTTYTYNTNCKLSQLLQKTTNGIITKYVYGLGLIGEEKQECGFKTYHFDYRGSTVAITDISGNITDTFKYDTYGKVTEHIGDSFVIFGYNGRDGVVTDKNGLIYMRARYYSPNMRRFVNADIIHGEISNAVTLNRYAYANGNPVSNVDPFGLAVDEKEQYTLDGFIKNLQKLYQLASSYYLSTGKIALVEQLNMAVMSCFTVGRFYSDGDMKTIASCISAGVPNYGFIAFANSFVGKGLDEYIFSPNAILIVDDMKIDIPHLMMTLSAITTDTDKAILSCIPSTQFSGLLNDLGSIGDGMLDDYSGWCGDLITLAGNAQDLVNQGKKLDDVYDFVIKALNGDKASSFSPSDLIADMDASNMSGSVRYLPISAAFSLYYGEYGGAKRRRELFIKNEFSNFPFMVELMSKMYLSPYNPVTSSFNKIIDSNYYSKDTANEVARAFSDFLLS